MKTCPQCSTGYPDSLTTCPTHGVPLNEIRDLKPGMIIHQSYRIVRKLGQGGMGAVYLARCPRSVGWSSCFSTVTAAWVLQYPQE